MDFNQPPNGHSKRKHVVLLPLLNAGHLPPFVQLLFYLDSRCPGLIVTITATPKFAADLAEWQGKGDLQNIDLRVERIPGIVPRDEKTYKILARNFGAQNFLETESLREKLKALKSTPEAPTSIICDMFFHWCKDLAEELGGIPWYIYYSCYPVYTILIVEHSQLMKGRVGERAKTNPGEVLSVAAPAFENAPGAGALHLEDIPAEEYFQCADFYEKLAAGARHAAGILQNTAEELDEESGTIRAMRGVLGDDRVFAVGPAIQMEGFGRVYSSPPMNELLPWLNQQRENSVLYVAFGSTVVSPTKVIHEIAAALEASGVPFIWAVKLLPGSPLGLSDLLPEGFLERTAERGLVLTGWLPQIRILQHSAVGAFLTHCGFNSFLESVCAGKPTIGWPAGADQFMVLRYLAQLARVGVSIASYKTDDRYSFENITHKEIEMAIRTVMLEDEGPTLRANVQKLQKAVIRAVQEGGSSHRDLERLADQLYS